MSVQPPARSNRTGRAGPDDLVLLERRAQGGPLAGARHVLDLGESRGGGRRPGEGGAEEPLAVGPQQGVVGAGEPLLQRALPLVAREGRPEVARAHLAPALPPPEERAERLATERHAPVLPAHRVVPVVDLGDRQAARGAEGLRPRRVRPPDVALQLLRQGVEAEEAGLEEVPAFPAVEDVAPDEAALREPPVERLAAEDEASGVLLGLQAVARAEDHDDAPLGKVPPVEGEAARQGEGQRSRRRAPRSGCRRRGRAARTRSSPRRARAPVPPPVPRRRRCCGRCGPGPRTGGSRPRPSRRRGRPGGSAGRGWPRAARRGSPRARRRSSA